MAHAAINSWFGSAPEPPSSTNRAKTAVACLSLTVPARHIAFTGSFVSFYSFASFTPYGPPIAGPENSDDLIPTATITRLVMGSVMSGSSRGGLWKSLINTILGW